MYKKRIVISIALLPILIFGKDYFLDSHRSATGKTPEQLSSVRQMDTEFIYVAPTCCCNDKIINLFKNATTDETKNRINPATDQLINALTMVNERLDLKIKQVQNYRLVNALYSFADRTNANNRYGDNNIIGGDTVIGGDGCHAIDFSKPEDREWYQHNVIDKFEAGSNYEQEGFSSSAFGRYQFMPDTGSSYCERAPSELNCCGGTWTNKEGMVFTGGEWRTGANAQACQDAMFQEFTQDNVDSLSNKGIPQNSCTIYLAHQQGIGGLNWLNGGSLPIGTSVSIMSERVRVNVGEDQWNSAIANGMNPTDEESLRNLYVSYWNEKFGGNILSGEGEIVPIEKIAEQSEQFSSLSGNRDTYFREGILFELYRQKEEIKSVMKNFSTQPLQ